MKNVIVVGGGLSGLGAARQLVRSGHAVTVFEACDQAGGRLRSLEHGGAHVELGAAFVTDFYPTVMATVTAAGLHDRLLRYSQTAAVVRDGRTRSIWPARGLVRRGPLSFRGLVRLGAGIALALLPRWRRLDPGRLTSAAPDDDESVDAWAGRSLGPDAARYFIGPLLRGLLYWESANTSKAPLLVMLKAALTAPGTYRVVGGMQALHEELARGSDVRCGVRVTSVDRAAGGWVVRYLRGSDEATATCDGVVVALPAEQALKVVSEVPAELAEFLRHVTYSRTAVAVFDLPVPPRDSEVVLFCSDEEPVLASVNPHLYLSDEVGGSHLVKVYLSSRGFDAMQHLDDAELAERVLQHVRSKNLDGYDWSGARTVSVERWTHALPEFGVGYLRRLARLKDPEAGGDGLAFAGDYLWGPYMEGALQSGLRAAAYLETFLVRTEEEPHA